MTGKDKVKEVYKNLTPGNKSVFINMEAIEALPEEFDVIITDVKFDPKNLENSFTNVGTKNDPLWYPHTELAYDIAEARGIIGHGEKTIETITEEVDINPMLLKGFEDPQTMRIMQVGVRVTKTSKVLCEDGTYRASSPCTNEFNYWDRAVLDWLKEEKYTENYSKTGKYGYKYNTSILRKLRYMELKKFAIAQAETKAFVKTVRELAGLPTGFKTEDLQGGKLTLFKIVRSKSIIKLETAARIDAIRGGRTEEIENKMNQVFETPKIEAPIQDVSDGGKNAPIVKEEVCVELSPGDKINGNTIVIEPVQNQEPLIFFNTEPEKKDFSNMSYPEKKEYLKTIQFAEWNTEYKKKYLRDMLMCYIDPEGENIKTLKKISNAMSAIEYKIEHYADVNIDDFLKFIKKIESQKGIIKLDTTLP